MTVRHRSTVSYEFVRVVDGSVSRNVVRATCGRCGATRDIAWPDKHNPEAVAKQFRRRGWEFDIYNAKHNVCPACLAPACHLHPQEEETEPMAPTPKVVPIAPPPNVASDAAVGQVRDPTMAEMRRICSMLDSHFDDKAGVYLKGWSDRRVSEELNLPMAIVTKVRREAFGELKVNADIAALRDELRALLDKAADLETRLNAIAEQAA